MQLCEPGQSLDEGRETLEEVRRISGTIVLSNKSYEVARKQNQAVHLQNTLDTCTSETNMGNQREDPGRVKYQLQLSTLVSITENG